MKSMPWAAVVLALLGLVSLWLLAGILQSHPQNADVARVASQALDMAEAAHQHEVASEGNGTILRVLALAVGVAAPLVVAYLIHRVHSRSEPPPEEVLETLEKAKLLDWKAEQRRLPDGTHTTLTEAPEAKTHEPSDAS